MPFYFVKVRDVIFVTVYWGRELLLFASSLVALFCLCFYVFVCTFGFVSAIGLQQVFGSGTDPISVTTHLVVVVLILGIILEYSRSYLTILQAVVLVDVRNELIDRYLDDKKLSYRREAARQLCMST